MERRTMQVLDVRDMRNLKGGGTIIPGVVAAVGTILDQGGGLPPDPDELG